VRRIATLFIIGVIVLTGCGQNSSSSDDIQNSSSSDDIQNSSSSVDIQIKLDEACALAREAFSLEGEALHSEGESLFYEAGKEFRKLVVDYPSAEKFMKGSLAASNEAHRYGNGYSIYVASKQAHYISKDDGDAIIATYEYCSAGAE